jgi:lipoyl-dependent peroxiredoxin
MMPVDVKYSTTAHATGGRDGRTRTEDSKIDLALAVPKELGGQGGDGTNPEQLFGAGYAACFLSAMKHAAQQLKVQVPADASVSATIGIGMREGGGFGINADLEVSLPGLDQTHSEQVVELAHQVCPYSNAIRNNVDVHLSVARVV